MAKKNTEAAAAAKAKKQKMFLIFGGIALLGLGVIQGPKLLKHGGGAEPATPAVAVAVATGTGTVAPSSPTAIVASGPAGSVAGVALPGATVVRVSPNQLASFTMFEVKDPFVQQAGDEPATSTAAAPPPADTATPPPTASGSAAPPPAAVPVTYATINVDGKPQQLVVKEQFPKGEPMFVLVSLKKKQAKIGVAGGSFDNGKTVTLQLGKKLTLLNTATSVRYQLKLVYTGTEPEAIEGFSAGKPQASTPATTTTSTVDASTGAAAASTP